MAPGGHDLQAVPSHLLATHGGVGATGAAAPPAGEAAPALFYLDATQGGAADPLGACAASSTIHPRCLVPDRRPLGGPVRLRWHSRRAVIFDSWGYRIEAAWRRGVPACHHLEVACAWRPRKERGGCRAARPRVPSGRRARRGHRREGGGRSAGHAGRGAAVAGGAPPAAVRGHAAAGAPARLCASAQDAACGELFLGLARLGPARKGVALRQPAGVLGRLRLLAALEAHAEARCGAPAGHARGGEWKGRRRGRRQGAGAAAAARARGRARRARGVQARRGRRACALGAVRSLAAWQGVVLHWRARRCNPAHAFYHTHPHTQAARLLSASLCGFFYKAMQHMGSALGAGARAGTGRCGGARAPWSCALQTRSRDTARRPT